MRMESPFTFTDTRSAPACKENLRVHMPWMVTLFILIGVFGRSPAAVGAVSIFFTTSMPFVILPNTGCFDGPGVNQSRYELCTVLMKNCPPPEFGRPVFAIDSVPGSFEIL